MADPGFILKKKNVLNVLLFQIQMYVIKRRIIALFFNSPRDTRLYISLRSVFILGSNCFFVQQFQIMERSENKKNPLI